eukprot:TRINITY_DN26852_c0_g1_i1.p1 TRINITY_DN26852_c0_g1~~TRINITY_DN26852_c0_g1_i1.p1  ORF type:complete len:151 (+),score=14.43 TRINITY_DN26852_c0_g1_i1:40-492(+)
MKRMNVYSLFLLFVSLLGACVAHVNTQPYDHDIAMQQLLFSYSAYCPESDIASWTCYWCNKYPNYTTGFNVMNVVYNSSTNILAYVGYDTTNDAIQVVFRGTQPQSIKDWIEDMEFGHKIPYPKNPDVFVHGGFYNAYLSIRDERIRLDS